MDPKTLRARADRCRELLRGAVRDDICEQLRQWAEDFDDEADALGSVEIYRELMTAEAR
jgi:hypothetical protein